MWGLKEIVYVNWRIVVTNALHSNRSGAKGAANLCAFLAILSRTPAISPCGWMWMAIEKWARIRIRLIRYKTFSMSPIWKSKIRRRPKSKPVSIQKYQLEHQQEQERIRLQPQEPILVQELPVTEFMRLKWIQVDNTAPAAGAGATADMGTFGIKYTGEHNESSE